MIFGKGETCVKGEKACVNTCEMVWCHGNDAIYVTIIQKCLLARMLWKLKINYTVTLTENKLFLFLMEEMVIIISKW
jgi:hypothetical protein